MKLECAGCKKILSEDDFDECHSVYKCRKDHIFVCCKVECARMFEKKCAKVADNLLKMQHKLNNDGHTSALRRLPPCEREKFKQHSEAEANGLMICPEEVKACERSVPNCAHVIHRTGGYSKEERQTADDAEDSVGVPPPPPGPEQAGKENQDQELVSDDMLQEIRRDDDLIDDSFGIGNANVKAKKEKAQKGRKEKKGQPLLIDWKTPPVNAEEPNSDAWGKTAATPKPFQPAPYTPAPARTPGGLGAAQWSAVASRLGGEAQAEALTGSAAKASRPTDCLQRAKTLASTTGCTDQRAVELLEQHTWDLDKAADAFFRQTAGPGNERATDGPRWGPRAGQQSPQQQAQQQQQPQQQQSQQSQQPQQQQQPSQQAQQQQQPQQQQPQQQQQQQQQQQRQQQPQQQQQQQQQQRQQQQQEQQQEQQPQTSEAASAQPPAPSQPPPPRLPPDWQAIWAETQSAYYFWHLPSNRTTWDPPEMDESATRTQQAAAAENARREAMVSEACQITGIDSDAAHSLLESHNWNLEAAIRSHVQKQEAAAAKRRAEEEAAAARAAEEAKQRAAEEARAKAAQSPAVGPGTYVSTQHWRPPRSIHGCIRVFHGERVRVSWTDGQEQGWAFGVILEEPSKEGYFPQAILKELKHQPRGRRAGEKCTAVERFDAPEEVGGYASAQPGDTMKVLHSMVEPYVWVYVERINARGLAPPEVGWVPECILSNGLVEVRGDHRQGGPGPNPAG